MAYGLRTCGTENNDIHTMKYILDQVEKLKITSKPGFKIESDLQLVSVSKKMPKNVGSLSPNRFVSFKSGLEICF